MNNDKIFIDGYKLPPPLSKEETYNLFQAVNKGSEDAREKLITHNIRLVLYEVNHKFKNVDYDKEDLVSIGNIGLLKAINTYSLTKNSEFSTYATKCIDNEILIFLRKLKNNHMIDSIDRIIYEGKNGSEMKLADILADDKNLVEEYEKIEMYKIIRQLVMKLPDRDKEIIMLYFGFYNNKIYTQEEIAEKIHVSQPNISRLIIKNVKILRKQFEEEYHLELNSKKEKQEYKKENNKMRKLQTIYQYFKDYTKEQIDAMLKKLTDEERELITLRYGEDLNNPVSTKLSEEQSMKFYSYLVPKMKRMLANPNHERKKRTRKSKEESTQTPTISKSSRNQLHQQLVSHNEEIVSTVIIDHETPKIEPTTSISKIKEKPIQSTQETKEKQLPIESETQNNDITKDNCLKILELLRTPTFSQMMNHLTIKEAIIISLKLGYIDGKYFKTESIAKFLEISEEEVRETTKKILLLYKDNVNNFLDRIIEIATDNDNKKRILSIENTNEKH